MSCANGQLSAAQKAIMDQIVNLGHQLGTSTAQIGIAVQVAFQESSLGQNLSNPNSSATGLFQYTNGTWSDRHSDLDRNDFGDQIIAFYRDIVDLQGRYNGGRDSGQIPSHIGFGEYVYIRHHDGWYYSDLENAPGGYIYDSFLNFCIDQTSPPSGGGASWTDPSQFEGGDGSSWVDSWIEEHSYYVIPIITFSDLQTDQSDWAT